MSRRATKDRAYANRSARLGPARARRGKELRQRLEESTSAIRDNFRSLIRASQLDGARRPGEPTPNRAQKRLTDGTLINVQSFDTTVFASSVISSLESLLELTAELKTMMMLNDMEALNTAVDARESDEAERRKQICAKLVTWQGKLSSHRRALEARAAAHALLGVTPETP
eukprot:UC1_evm1s1825